MDVPLPLGWAVPLPLGWAVPLPLEILLSH
jgi:hypothetical protein